jgi:hypothetical protein
LELAKKQQYAFVNFHTVLKNKGYKTCLLRHDIDNSPEAALLLAEIEYQHAVKSNYFFMLSSESYNCRAPSTRKIMERIIELGHEVCLHFSEGAYSDLASGASSSWEEKLRNHLYKEVAILEELIYKPVTAVSFHQPSADILKYQPRFDRIINTYRQEDVGGAYYSADSCMTWRGPEPETIFLSGLYQHVQLLIHPMWWRASQEDLQSRWLNALDERIATIWTSWQKYEKTMESSWKIPTVKLR